MTLLTIVDITVIDEDSMLWAIEAELLHDGETYEVIYSTTVLADEDGDPYSTFKLNVLLNNKEQYPSWGAPAETHLAKTLKQSWITGLIETSINRIKDARIQAQEHTIAQIRGESFKFQEEQ